MNIALSHCERDLLLENSETRESACRLLAEENSCVLSGSLEQFDELRDLCSNLLLRVGFDESYLPTPEGTTLELLIDKLFV